MEILGITPGALRKVPSEGEQQEAPSQSAPAPADDSAEQMSLGLEEFVRPAERPERIEYVARDVTPHLLVEKSDEEVERVRIRELFLVSIILHLALILLIVTHPGIFAPQAPVLPKPEKLTMLYEPPLEQPRRVPAKLPPVPQLPRANGSLNSEQPPVPAQNQLPLLPDNQKPAAKPEQGQNPNPPGGQDKDKTLQANNQSPPPGPQTKEPRLEQVQPPKQPEPNPKMQFPSLASNGGGTDAILRDLARQHASGQGMGGDGGIYPGPSEGSDSGFNLPGPQILSDTMGVNFDPYLVRIYLLIRKNWLSVIPDIVRLGKQGRVSLEFSIRRDGSISGLTLISNSGVEAMDGAAMSSIRLSNPFPPLPGEFPGPDIRLRYGYCYNMDYNKCVGH